MKNKNDVSNKELTLDPENWDKMRALGHQMIDDMMNYLQHIRDEPAWKKMPEEAKHFLKQDIPKTPQPIESIYEEFKQYIFPYPKGNIHPRYWAWVEGTGSPLGALSEMLAATMNPILAIGEHSAMYVEEQVLSWCKQMMGFPRSSSGVLTSGASIANITALVVARNHQLGENIRKYGVNAVKGQMVLYCSSETHSCIQKAAEAIGLGTDAVRKIAVDDHYRIKVNELENTIKKDLEDGFAPFCIVGNMGTVNTSAIDPLDDILNIARRFNLWFHIDGAFGALAKIVPAYITKLKAMEEADSVAFDLHKWMYMPYAVACVLIKNSEAHRNAFVVEPNYLINHERGIAAGPDPISNYGLELSKEFRSLKVWMSVKEHGIEKYSNLLQQNIAQAHYLAALVKSSSQLELMAPVSLNVVCYRYKEAGLATESLNKLNEEIVMKLQELGIAVPSSTILKEQYVIRVAITNHRSKKADFDVLIKETIRIGNEMKERVTKASPVMKNI